MEYTELVNIKQRIHRIINSELEWVCEHFNKY